MKAAPNDPVTRQEFADSISSYPMLPDFIASLPTRCPEAHLELTEPVKDDADALARFEVLCRGYAEIANCAADLSAEEAYIAYISELSKILGIDPEKTKATFDRLLARGIVAGSVLDLIVTEGSTHGLHAADFAEGAAPGVDIGEAFFSAGVSVLASIGVALFKKINGQKRVEVTDLTEVAYLNARLAKALMTPGTIGLAQDVLEYMSGKKE